MKNEGLKVEISTEKQETALTIIPKQEKTVTPADRIENLSRMQIVASRYEHLVKKKGELNDILRADDGLTGCKLYIEDSKNNEFEISNPAVISELLEVADKKLDILINKESEALLSMEV